MPIVCGEETPALEWCSIEQAVCWIERGQEPVDEFYEGVRRASMTDCQSELVDEERLSGLSKLYLLAQNSRVRLRGTEVTTQGPKFSPNLQVPANAATKSILEYQIIDPVKIRSIDVRRFCDMFRYWNGCLEGDGGSQGHAWAYSNIQANFLDLKRRCIAPSQQAIEFRRLRRMGIAVPTFALEEGPFHEASPIISTSTNSESKGQIVNNSSRRPQGKKGEVWDWLDAHFDECDLSIRNNPTELDKRIANELNIGSSGNVKTYRNSWIRCKRLS